MQKPLLSALLLMSIVAFAEAPPSSITSVQILNDALVNYFSYAAVTPIGVCIWFDDSWPPSVETTFEFDEYQPDLVVTVFDQPGDDPWVEANTLLDPPMHAAGSGAVGMALGSDLGYGHNNAVVNDANDQNIRTYVVDVIGSPLVAAHATWMLRSDTAPYMPYYSSDLDAVSDRTGLAEALKWQTYNPFNYYVGSNLFNNWGYEFPRVMSINQTNNYKGAVLSALHAADIVTNSNALHVVQSTADSCGQNCAVANVIEETQDDHEKWEEVYPFDKPIQLGESDFSSSEPLGQDDDKAGKGNYVFLVWRHYKGCIQGDGDLIFAAVDVPPTIKR